MSDFRLGVVAGMLISLAAQSVVYLIVGHVRRAHDSNGEPDG